MGRLSGSRMGMRFHPYNDKIADITESDLDKHEITLATMGLPLNTVCLLIYASRFLGTGVLRFYPNEGTQFWVATTSGTNIPTISVGIINQRLQYALTVINDDFDLFCMGYFTE